MSFEDSLEYDILSCFWEVNWPLSVKDVQDALSEKNVDVPFDILQRVIRYLEAAQILKSQSNIEWGKRYRPTMSALKFSFNPWVYLYRATLQERNAMIKRPPFFRSLLSKIQLLF